MNDKLKQVIKSYGITLALLLVIIVIYAVSHEPLSLFEYKTFDIRMNLLAEKQQHDSGIVQLLLDDHSTFIAAEQKELGLGRIPWPRRVWGEVVEFLNRTEPTALVFDINFLGPEGDDPANIQSDLYFTEAVRKSKAKVFFAILFTDSVSNLMNNNVKDINKEIKIRLLKVPLNLLKLLDNNHIQVEDNLHQGAYVKKFITYTVFTPIMEGLLREGDGFGTINLKTDVDSVNRMHVPLYIYNGVYYPSLPLAVAYALLPPEEQTVTVFEDKIKLGSREIFIDEEGKNYTTWYGQPKTYKVFHVIDVIISERNLKQGKKPTINPDEFRNKIIIIGQTASGYDIHHTAVSNVFVGTEIVATNIDNLLNQKKFIVKMNPYYNLILAILFSFLIYSSVMKSKSNNTTILLSAFIMLIYVLISIFALTELKIWIELVGPFILLVLVFVTTYVVKYIFTSRQLESAIEQATKDGLTKLYNHRFFQEKIHQDLANAGRKDDKVSLCLIDIDFFKKFNDTYGHRAGDAVLIQVAQALKDNVRKSDLVARYGGEEMCVLLDKTGVEDTLLVAEKLVKAIEEKIFLINDGKKEVRVTISIGCSTYPIHAKTVQDLIEFADKGLYRAKENGRNQVGALYDEDILLSDKGSGEKQIKEVEISKAKLIKSLDDFIHICKEKEYNFQEYIYYLIRDKEILLTPPQEESPQQKPAQTKPSEALSKDE